MLAIGFLVFGLMIETSLYIIKILKDEKIEKMRRKEQARKDKVKQKVD